MKSRFFEQLLFIFIHINKFTQKKLTSKIQNISIGFWRGNPNGSCPAWSLRVQFLQFFWPKFKTQRFTVELREMLHFTAANKQKKVPRGRNQPQFRHANRALGRCRVTRGSHFLPRVYRAVNGLKYIR